VQRCPRADHQRARPIKFTSVGGWRRCRGYLRL